jgi:DNA-binding transcriptional LysR family regulator
LDIRFLQSLLSVVETGSIAAAARREGLTAAAVSQRIQALEKTLGCELLSRTAHTARPSQACLALLPRARHLIAEAAKLRDDIEGDTLSGEMKIGAISTALTGILPQVLDEAARAAPKLRLRLVPGTSLQLYEQLVAGNLDAAVLVQPPFAIPKSLTAKSIRLEPLMLMTRDPMDGETIEARILQQPFIRYDPSSWGGQIALGYLERKGLIPDVRFDLDALETIALLVTKGLGNALVPAWQGLTENGFHLVPLKDAESHARHLVFLHSSAPGRPKTLDFILDLVLKNQQENCAALPILDR